MKISTIGGKPLISGGKVVVTPGGPCACGDCGGGGPVTTCCPSATLLCDQVSASVGWPCGYNPNELSCRVFQTVDYTQDLTVVHPPTNTLGHGVCHGHYDSGTCVLTATGTYTINGVPFCLCNNSCGGSLPCSCSQIGVYPSCNYNEVVTVSGSTVTITYDVDCGGGPHSVEYGSSSWAYSDEVTPADPELPPYDDDFDDPCSAGRTDCGGSTMTISRFRYKFTFDEPLTKDCKLCWIIRTTLTGEDPTDEFICETVSAGSTESSVHEVLEPDSNGTRTVVFPVGPCCASNGDCSITDQAKCESDGGEFQEGFCSETACEDVTCTPKTGACCNYDDNTCTITTEADCTCPACSWAGPDTICPDDCFF